MPITLRKIAYSRVRRIQKADMMLSNGFGNLFKENFAGRYIPIPFPICPRPLPQLSAFSRMQPLMFHVYPGAHVGIKIGNCCLCCGRNQKRGGEEAPLPAAQHDGEEGNVCACNRVCGYAGGYIWSRTQGQGKR